jgi:hypothetical protein
MKIERYSSHRRHFVSISSLIFLTFLLAACGGSSTSGGSVTPTPVKTGTLQTSCPPAGKARAAIMAPLALGKQDTFVYVEGSQSQQPTPYTLKRYNVSTRTTKEIETLPNNPSEVNEAHMSADGQWVLLHTSVSGQSVMQLVRMDGQGLQTLYCASGSGFGFIQWSPDNKYVAFVDVGTPGQDQSTGTFKLLNTTTGTIETKPRDSTHVLEAPIAWLDNTHLYVVSGFGPGEESKKLSLLDITSGTSKPILDLSSPQCLDATPSLDGTQLFTSLATECHQLGSGGTNRGPSNIQVQAATGGPPKTIYSTQTYAITALRFASSTSLLLLIKTDWEPSHNGLWKMNTDGSGLTRLNNEADIIKDAANEEMNFAGLFGWTMDQPWANASRDGAYYSIQVQNHEGNGSSRLLIGSMNGGAPMTVASGPVEAPVGWTTM